MNRYVDFNAYQILHNWTSESNRTVKQVEVPMRQCELNDFGDKNNKEIKKIFAQWETFNVFCPEYNLSKSLFLEKNSASIESYQIFYRLERCVN